MSGFGDVSIEEIVAGGWEEIGETWLNRLTAHPLACIEIEFPHYVGSVDSPRANVQPAEQHPIFYGCFDWHSAVHSHWCLIRQLRLFDSHPEESAIRSSINRRLTSDNVEAEVAYLDAHQDFERPYGWAWFLRLMAELHLWDDEQGIGWRRTLEPLEETVIELVTERFLPQERPFRVGTHGNSAFALSCIIDFARITGQNDLIAAAEETTNRFFLDDRAYPVQFEPLGWDFLSPALVEAEVMMRVMEPDAFVDWFDGFLPEVTEELQSSMLEPTVIDLEGAGGLELHFVGLNLSRAWCLATLADMLTGHRYESVFLDAALSHASVGLEQAFVEGYAGSHWLSSFALYLLTRHASGINPSPDH